MIRLGFNAKTRGNRASVGEKSFLTIFTVVCLLVAFSTTVSANPGAINVPGNYTSIQDAINNATDGDLIIVEPGRYNETVEISVSNITIQANATDPAETIVSANGSSDYVFTITGQNVTLAGFTIQEALVAGIYMDNARDCTFSDNIVTNISATGSDNSAYGVFLLESYNNSFSSMTVTNITAGDTAYGIYLDQSDDNTFEAVTIRPTIRGNDNYYEFYSEVNSDENVATNVTLGNPTTLSFTYANGIWIKRVSAAEKPANPPDLENIGKYITAGNLSSNSWLFVNFKYSQEDAGEVDESSLKVWKHNGTTWIEDGWNESRFLDTANNIVGVNITSFSLFAPLGSRGAEPGKGVNVTFKPETLNLASKGRFTAFIEFEGYDGSQINKSTVSCEGVPAVKVIAAGTVYIAKFNRRGLTNISTGNVTLTVTGAFEDGTPFEGSDIVRVIDQGKSVIPETGMTVNIENANKGSQEDNGKSKGNNNGKSKGNSTGKSKGKKK